jgi:hypothetical protein
MIHICNKKDERWKKLPQGTCVATQWPRPAGLDPRRWVQNISPDWYDSGEQMAQAILGGMRSGEPPAYVMIDELKASTVNKVADCAEYLKNHQINHSFPNLKGRWGAYLVNGTAVSYAKLNPAIDKLLEADAIVACEMYLKISTYQILGRRYLTRNMWGTKRKARLKWLIARKRVKNSNSHIIGLIGLTPKYLNRKKTGDFIREMQRTWGQIIDEPMGGWKWDIGTAIGVAPQWPGWSSKVDL